jgi:hypothetical protein
MCWQGVRAWAAWTAPALEHSTAPPYCGLRMSVDEGGAVPCVYSQCSDPLLVRVSRRGSLLQRHAAGDAALVGDINLGKVGLAAATGCPQCNVR